MKQDFLLFHIFHLIILDREFRLENLIYSRFNLHKNNPVYKKSP